MWKITKENVTTPEDHAAYAANPKEGLRSRVGWTSVDYVEGTELPFKFRMSDDDGNIYYYGYSNDNDSEEAFAPLDDLGTPDAGAVTIEYYKPETKTWEML